MALLRRGLHDFPHNDGMIARRMHGKGCAVQSDQTPRKLRRAMGAGLPVEPGEVMPLRGEMQRKRVLIKAKDMNAEVFCCRKGVMPL